MEDKAIIYKISQMDNERCMLYTRDTRVLSKDRSVECVNSKLINTMIMISELLADDGYSILFEVG